MKTNTNHFDFVVIATKSKLLATVNSCRKILSLLPITLAVLFSLKSIDVMAQDTKVSKQFSVTLQNQYCFKSGDKLIFTYTKDVNVLNGKDLTPGTRAIFMDTLTGLAVEAPLSLKDAKQICVYKSKIFFVKNDTEIYSFNFSNQEVKLLVRATDRIVCFFNTSDNCILVNALNGGIANIPYGVETVSRVAVYNYETNVVINITDKPNVYQAFSVGNKIVYSESSYWFNSKGVSFRANIYNIDNGKTYSVEDYNVLGLSIPTSDSTFILWFNPLGGGLWRLASVNVNKDLLPNGSFSKEDIIETSGFLAPPIAGGNLDFSASSIPYFMNNEIIGNGMWYSKNIKTGFVNKRSDDQVWSMNLNTFKENYIGKFTNFFPTTGGAGFGFVNNDRFVFYKGGSVYTTKLYGQTQYVKNLSIPGVSIYPNPASGTVKITVPENADIEIYSVDGRMTFSQKVLFGDTQIPISVGINTVKITIGNSVQIIKIVGY